MNYPMEQAGTQVLESQVDGRPWLPMSGVERADAGEGRTAAVAVRDLLDEQLLDQMVARVRADGARLTGPGGFLPEMLKAVLERGLKAELTDHLGYDKHETAGHGTGNSRNGATPKTLLTGLSPKTPTHATLSGNCSGSMWTTTPS